MQETRSHPWIKKITWRREWQPHSSILAWRIPRTEEPGGLQPMGLQRVGHNWVTNTHTHTQRTHTVCTILCPVCLTRNYAPETRPLLLRIAVTCSRCSVAFCSVVVQLTLELLGFELCRSFVSSNITTLHYPRLVESSSDELGICRADSKLHVNFWLYEELVPLAMLFKGELDCNLLSFLLLMCIWMVSSLELWQIMLL